jgi:hypothetical protein
MWYQNQQLHIGVLKYTINSTYLLHVSANSKVICDISMYLSFLMDFPADGKMIGRKM